MKLTNAILASLVALIVLSAPLAHAADTTASATTGQPLHFLWLKDGTGKIGGFVLTGLDSSDNLKVFIVVWGLSPNTLYTVWIADCTAQGPPGDYPCPQGGALNSGPGVFGTNSPSCPVAGEGGPLTFIQTNFFGFGSSNLISIPLKGVAYPGLHYAHFDMGIGCVPAPAYPPGFYATQGFSFTI